MDYEGILKNTTSVEQEIIGNSVKLVLTNEQKKLEFLADKLKNNIDSIDVCQYF